MIISRGWAKRSVLRLAALLALLLVGTVSTASVAHADPANRNTFTFDVVCDGEPLTLTVMMSAHPPSSNGAAAHIAASTGIGVLMGLSVRNLLTGEETTIVSKPLAERRELATCAYTFDPLLPPFLVFTAKVLRTPRG